MKTDSINSEQIMTDKLEPIWHENDTILVLALCDRACRMLLNATAVYAEYGECA